MWKTTLMKRDLGSLWHALAGLGIGLTIVVGGWVREKLQHPDGELSRHQKLEAGAWTIGLLVASLGGIIWWMV